MLAVQVHLPCGGRVAVQPTPRITLDAHSGDIPKVGRRKGDEYEYSHPSIIQSLD
jgi:hypothetical protein